MSYLSRLQSEKSVKSAIKGFICVMEVVCLFDIIRRRVGGNVCTPSKPFNGISSFFSVLS